MPDLLDNIWSKAINVDSDGTWMEQEFDGGVELQKYYAECGPALKRLRQLGRPVDLGHVSRLVRYEACFGLLHSFNDPGFPSGVPIQPDALIQAAFSRKKGRGKMERFLSSLREILAVEDDGVWLAQLAKKETDKSPFGDVGNAIARLIRHGVSMDDLGQLAIWSRYRACIDTLRLLHGEDFELNEIDGLHESLLGSDPSGLEGRPGSWPLKKRQQQGVGSRLDTPLWRSRGQAIAFSPDNRFLATGRSSGPARIHDAFTGKETVVCQGIKAHIYRLAFSPDGKRLAVADIDRRLDICSVLNGEVLVRTSFPAKEISSLCFSIKTGEILRSAWSKAIDVLDPVTGRKKEPLCPGPNTFMVTAMKFFPQGDRLITLWVPEEGRQQQVTVMSWPARVALVDFTMPADSVYDMAISPDGELVALSLRTSWAWNEAECVQFYNATTGKEVHRIEMTRPGAMKFLPNGVLIVANDTHLSFFAPTWKKVREIEFDGAYDISVSSDGKLVAITGFSGVRVWRV